MTSKRTQKESCGISLRLFSGRLGRTMRLFRSGGTTAQSVLDSKTNVDLFFVSRCASIRMFLGFVQVVEVRFVEAALFWLCSC